MNKITKIYLTGLGLILLFTLLVSVFMVKESSIFGLDLGFCVYVPNEAYQCPVDSGEIDWILVLLFISITAIIYAFIFSLISAVIRLFKKDAPNPPPEMQNNILNKSETNNNEVLG